MSLSTKKPIFLLFRGLALAGLIALRLQFPPEELLEGIYARNLSIVVGFLIFALSASLVFTLLAWLYRRSKKIRPGKNDNVIIGLQNIYYIVFTAALLTTLLGFWGIDLKTLFTSLSIVAAAIAIISKDYISEIISGIIISFSREISIDDYVKIGDHRGKIIDIHLTKIALLNEDDDLIFLPNNKVFTSEIVNYTRRDIKKVSIDFELMIPSLNTVEALEADLIAAVSEYQDMIVPDSYNLKIVELRRDSLVLKFQYVIKMVDRDLEREIRRKTVRQVVNYVKTKGKEEKEEKAKP